MLRKYPRMKDRDVGDHRIIFHQIIRHEDGVHIREITPPYVETDRQYLVSRDGELRWEQCIDVSTEIDIFDEHGRLKGTEFYFKDKQIGLGRSPLLTYGFDIRSNENCVNTAFHIGDGSHGLSFGNGTAEGFIPQIVGMGSDSNDAGLYFLGKSNSEEPSDIPLIIIGALSKKNNRPMLGVTGGEYSEYKFLIDRDGNVDANDFSVKGLYSVSDIFTIVKEQQDRIDELTNKMNEIVSFLNKK